ncbi:aminotransferase class III-fold pyridoxal phosphate-dependent enzyme [Parasphingorhabdus litoris]|uniref:Aminotransferase class III-fold pyridoxal phosphate-dependent enzyme n=1 Tax=Parasphingorhabdus litoris TaxID=394733 RepID=A0ABP3JV74_9SPHN|nr:aminotransferase class III-fold pyridoxal phosphate-dependent enzyme [Parasphingorhabdus litoris]
MVQNEDGRLKARALEVIPNGLYGHLSVKMQSPRTPQYYKRAKGAYLWDYDDNQYIDYLCAFGPNLFGYGHDEIDAAYIEQLREIDTATGPSVRMVELAEAYADQVSHCDWTMFCKNGTDATTMALMTARAYREKRKILIATGAYHGATKWCTPMPEGTVTEDHAHHIYYEYNNAQSLRRAVEEAGDDLAGVFATPFKHEVIHPQQLPDEEYARTARQLCDEKDALLILDDVRAGFRLDRDCSWEKIGVRPDLSSWGKTLANGHPLSCLMGSDRAREAAGKIFVTGSFWFGAAAMAAGLKTLELIRTTDYIERTIMLGDRLRDGLEQVSKETGIIIDQTGPSQMPLIMINDDDGNRNMPACVAFCDGLLDHGVFFHPFHNMFITPAMSEDDIDRTIDGCHAVAKKLPSIPMPEVAL